MAVHFDCKYVGVEFKGVRTSNSTSYHMLLPWTGNSDSVNHMAISLSLHSKFSSFNLERMRDGVVISLHAHRSKCAKPLPWDDTNSDGEQWLAQE